MNKKEIIITIAAVLLLCVIGIIAYPQTAERMNREKKEQETEEVSEMETEKKELISKEYLFENTKLKPEDFEEYGFDPDDFIRTFSLTEKDSKEERRIRVFYDDYVYYHTDHPEQYEEEYETRLEKVPHGKLEEGMLDDIKMVSLAMEREGGQFGYTFDFGENRVCSWNYEYMRETREEDREKLKKAITESGIGDFENTMVKHRWEAEWSSGYNFVLETNDGRTARYEGIEYLPEEIEMLYDRFKCIAEKQ